MRPLTVLISPQGHGPRNSQPFSLALLQGVSNKSWHSWEIKTLGTSYSETNNLLDLKLWQQVVLMSTPRLPTD